MDPKPITDDDDEKALLEEHGQPNAAAPDTNPEATDEVKEETPAEEEKPAVPAASDGGGKADPTTAGDGAKDDATGAVADVLTQPAKPATEPVAAVPDPFVTAKAGIDEKIAALRAQKKSGEIDPDDANDKINDLVMQRQDLTDQRTQQIAASAAYWEGFEDDTGITAKAGKQIWKEVVKDMAAKGRTSPDALATEFEHRLEKVKASPTPKPAESDKIGKVAIVPPTSAPLPKGNTKIAPAATAAATIPPKADKTDEEELLDHVRKIPGGLRG